MAIDGSTNLVSCSPSPIQRDGSSGWVVEVELGELLVADGLEFRSVARLSKLP
jgi:hypothetical protein